MGNNIFFIKSSPAQFSASQDFLQKIKDLRGKLDIAENAARGGKIKEAQAALKSIASTAQAMAGEAIQEQQTVSAQKAGAGNLEDGIVNFLKPKNGRPFTFKEIYSSLGYSPGAEAFKQAILSLTRKKKINLTKHEGDWETYKRTGDPLAIYVPVGGYEIVYIGAYIS